MWCDSLNKIRKTLSFNNHTEWPINTTWCIKMTSHERHVVSNHRSFHCFFNIWYGPPQTNTTVHITGPLWAELTCKFPSQRASDTKKASTLWRLHVVDWGRTSRALGYYNAFLSGNVSYFVCGYPWKCFAYCVVPWMKYNTSLETMGPYTMP